MTTLQDQRVNWQNVFVVVSCLIVVPHALWSQVYQHGGDWLSILVGAMAATCSYLTWRIVR